MRVCIKKKYSLTISAENHIRESLKCIVIITKTKPVSVVRSHFYDFYSMCRNAIKCRYLPWINSAAQTNLSCIPHHLLLRSYRSSGVQLWGFVSARPDTCPGRAGSCPLCTTCAASSPLRFCGGMKDTADIKYQNMTHNPIPHSCFLWNIIFKFICIHVITSTCTHKHTLLLYWTVCVITPVLHVGWSPLSMKMSLGN